MVGDDLVMADARLARFSSYRFAALGRASFFPASRALLCALIDRRTQKLEFRGRNEIPAWAVFYAFVLDAQGQDCLVGHAFNPGENIGADDVIGSHLCRALVVRPADGVGRLLVSLLQLDIFPVDHQADLVLVVIVDAARSDHVLVQHQTIVRVAFDHPVLEERPQSSVDDAHHPFRADPVGLYHAVLGADLLELLVQRHRLELCDALGPARRCRTGL